MAKIKHKQIPILEILVNRENPRFDPVQNQDKAIQLMLKEEESSIKKLAKNIATHGLNPTKRLAVMSKNGKFLTLEGNRRVVALKLLNAPNTTSNQEIREFFHDLKTNHNKNIPNNASCTIFENEDDAHHWISLEHTGLNQGIGIKQWKPIQKDRFLKKSSKRIQIFEFADNNNIDRDKVEATNIERLISTPYVRDTIGISFVKEKLELTKPKKTVQKNLSKVFSAISKTNFVVEDIYKKDDREKWIDTVIKTRDSNDTKNAVATNSRRQPESLPKSTLRKHLIPSDLELIIHQDKINTVFRELRDDLLLDNSRKATPNAVAVLFRVFLESSLYHYLQKKGIEMGEKASIIKMIGKATERMEEEGIATIKQLKNIRTTTHHPTDYLHIERFHEYVHSETVRPESDGLKARWDNLQEFFELLWNDLNQNGS